MSGVVNAISRLLYGDEGETKYKDKKFSNRLPNNVARQTVNPFTKVLTDSRYPGINMNQLAEHMSEGEAMYEDIEWDEAARKRLTPKWNGSRYDPERNKEWTKGPNGELVPVPTSPFSVRGTSENVLFEELNKFLRSRKR